MRGFPNVPATKESRLTRFWEDTVARQSTAFPTGGNSRLRLSRRYSAASRETEDGVF